MPFSDSYTTGFLDLTCSTADLQSSLASKWRNVLNKTEKLGLNVHSLDINHESINFIIKEYRRHQLERGYTGIPDDLLLSLLNHHSSSFPPLLKAMILLLLPLI